MSRRTIIENARDPVVFLHGGIGDMIIAWPTLRALSLLSRGRMKLFSYESTVTSLLRDVGFRDWIFAGEYVGPWIEDPELALERISPCDLFISLTFCRHESFPALARSAGAKSIGFFRGFDVEVPAAPTNRFDQFFKMAQYFDPAFRLEDFSGPPRFSWADENNAERFVLGLRARREYPRVLLVHPETFPEKLWPLDNFRFVVGKFLEQRPDYQVIVCSRLPYELGLSGFEHRITQLGEPLPMALAAAKHCDLFLGIDSCFLHAADAFHVPGVALFGPTDPQTWGFRFSKSSRCLRAPTMSELEPAHVLTELLEVAQSAVSTPTATGMKNNVKGECNQVSRAGRAG